MRKDQFIDCIYTNEKWFPFPGAVWWSSIEISIIFTISCAVVLRASSLYGSTSGRCVLIFLWSWFSALCMPHFHSVCLKINCTAVSKSWRHCWCSWKNFVSRIFRCRKVLIYTTSYDTSSPFGKPNQNELRNASEHSGSPRMARTNCKSSIFTTPHGNTNRLLLIPQISRHYLESVTPGITSRSASFLKITMKCLLSLCKLIGSYKMWPFFYQKITQKTIYFGTVFRTQSLCKDSPSPTSTQITLWNEWKSKVYSKLKL